MTETEEKKKKKKKEKTGRCITATSPQTRTYIHEPAQDASFLSFSLSRPLVLIASRRRFFFSSSPLSYARWCGSSSRLSFSSLHSFPLSLIWSGRQGGEENEPWLTAPCALSLQTCDVRHAVELVSIGKHGCRNELQAESKSKDHSLGQRS